MLLVEISTIAPFVKKESFYLFTSCRLLIFKLKEFEFMKKNLVLISCLSLILILVGCNSDKKVNKSIQTTNENQTLKDVSKNINNSTQATNEQNSVDEKVTKVNGKVKLYEGTYFDDGVYKDTILKKYYEVVISNVTNTSFNFTAYEVDRDTKNREVIFIENTAVFTGDGTKATFYGKNYTLNFTFPNNHGAYPVVTDMEISGFKPLEGKTYVNNGIPGHEFG